jgi:Ca2+-binding RTX toxin-like protein
MPLQLFASDDIAAGVRGELGDLDDAFISTGATVESIDSTTIRGTGHDQSVNVQGAVLSVGYATIMLGDDDDLDYANTIIVGPDGLIGGLSGADAIYMQGWNSRIENSGTIYSTVYLEGVGHGSVTSVILNDGIIDGNSGTAIFQGGFSTEELDIVNTGVISGHTAFRSDVMNAAGKAVITNTGHIEGYIDFGAGDDIFDSHAGTFAGNVDGHEGNDTIIGAAEDDTFNGDEGNDILDGGVGNDILDGGVGNDILDGGAGDDQLFGETGADHMIGRAGADIYDVQDAGDIVDEGVAGSNGLDTVYASVSFSFSHAAHAKGNLENLTIVNSGAGTLAGTGNGLANVLIGYNGNVVLRGLGGNDTITGGAGTDTLRGDGGNDRLDGDLGADHMFGGTGNDTYVVDNAGDIVDETGGNGMDQVLARLSFSLAGAAHAKGSIENLTLLSGGNASATGNGLANILTGNVGNNAISGLGGNDAIKGGLGLDTLTGGGGDDSFKFAAAAESTGAKIDVIKDFDDAGNDRIDLSAVFGGTLVFKGTGAFTGIGQVHIHDIAGPDVLVEVNLSGNATPEMVIHLANTTAASMTASDFAL